MADEQTSSSAAPSTAPAQPLPTPPPVPTPAPAQPTTTSADNAALLTAILAMPERVAHAVRESIPASTPTQPANESKKNESTSGTGDAGTSSPKPTPDETPGKQHPRVKFFGMNWL